MFARKIHSSTLFLDSTGIFYLNIALTEQLDREGDKEKQACRVGVSAGGLTDNL